jgi:hypothetical protein
MRLGDIVAAQLQDAPDYSESAPLFLSSLYYLSDGASYYNPTQATQAQSGGSMANLTPTQDTCTQIQCGAITQEQAGPALVAACSAAGYVGAKTCDDPACNPYKAAMVANGMCPGAAPPSSPVPMPTATTARMPSITKSVAPMPVVTPSLMNQRMPSIVNPAPAVMAQPCGDTFAQWVNQNKAVAVGGLVVLALLMLGGRKG